MKINHFIKWKQPLLRHFTHAFFWIFILVGIAMLSGNFDVPDHNFEWFLGYLMFLSSALLFVPSLIVAAVSSLNNQDEKLIGFAEAMISVSMILSWIGAFGFYRAGFGYDTFVHFASSMFITLAVLVFFDAAGSHKEKKQNKNIYIIILFIFAICIINEGLELAGDQLFGTKMYGEVGQPDDTARDIVADTAGIITALFVRRLKIINKI